MSGDLLPDPALIDSLRALASHTDPDVRSQATELCAVLALPIRLRAAEALAERGRLAAAALCIWPDAPESQARFLRSLAHTMASSLRSACPEDAHLDELLASIEERDRTGRRPPTLRARRRALERSRLTDPRARIAAHAALSLCEEDPAEACRRVLEAVGLLSGGRDVASLKAAAFLRRTLNEQALVGAPLRRALAAAFVAALDEGRFEQAQLLLTPGCAYENRGRLLHTPATIIDSYARSSADVSARFPDTRSESRIVSEDDQGVTVDSAEHLAGPQGAHTFRCRQRLLFDNTGRIWRIEHHDLPGELGALETFLRRVET
ncbi:MAG: hypothetical protein ACI8S6_004238 [Myxococcota bacterium]